MCRKTETTSGYKKYNKTSTDEIQNTTINGNEVRYLNIYIFKNKMTSRILIDSKKSFLTYRQTK
jgi:RNA polymerase-interacting CarD/CdnL/TRCF family regulator